jgi:hypothetical protein
MSKGKFIPAVQPMTLVEIDYDYEDHLVTVHRHPIIGWRVGGCFEPLFSEDKYEQEPPWPIAPGLRDVADYNTDYVLFFVELPGIMAQTPLRQPGNSVAEIPHRTEAG